MEEELSEEEGTFSGRPDLDQVAALVDDLEQAPWVSWGLWGDEEELQFTRLRIQAGQFDQAESGYLTQSQPPDTAAIRLQRALSRLLGRG